MINISISCGLTSLLVLVVAVVLGGAGAWHRQATCLLVDSVLFLIAVFFFLLHMAIHW